MLFKKYSTWSDQDQKLAFCVSVKSFVLLAADFLPDTLISLGVDTLATLSSATYPQAEAAAAHLYLDDEFQHESDLMKGNGQEAAQHM